MKSIAPIVFAALTLFAACATVGPPGEADCPAKMTESEYNYGAVQCRALCSSWGRDFDHFRADCKCVCRRP